MRDGPWIRLGLQHQKVVRIAASLSHQTPRLGGGVPILVDGHDVY